MQVDEEGREGTDESNCTQITQQQEQDKREHIDEFDLAKYLKNHGVSDRAFTKMAYDVVNGDINTKLLINCDENELNDICDGYKLTWIQKKAFIKAVKCLKESSAETRESQGQFIYVSPNEQAIFDEINVDKVVFEFVKQINNSFSIERNKKTKSSKTYGINKIDWKFDFHHDCGNRIQR